VETGLDLRAERPLLPPVYDSSDTSWCSQQPPSSVVSLFVAIAAAAAPSSPGSDRIVKTLKHETNLRLNSEKVSVPTEIVVCVQGNSNSIYWSKAV
jgi:hypothetical protein